MITSDSGPVRLCPWLENPYGLVSLWDMIQCSVEAFFNAGIALSELRTDCLLKPGPGEARFNVGDLYIPVDDKTRSKTAEWLRSLEVHCSKIGLVISVETIREILVSLAGDRETPKYQWLMDKLGNLQQLIRKEIKSKLFFYVAPEKLRLCPTDEVPNIFGDAVVTAFPSADSDIREAGLCLATARATASVFHLMRVLEIGLVALGSVFGVSLAHTNWAPAIDQIESKIREMHKGPDWKARPDCREQHEFYSQAASHFGVMKDAWRNYTAHARGLYTEERATLIFDNVRAFMQGIAVRLHEKHV